MRQSLARQYEAGGAVAPLEGIAPRDRRLHRVAGAPDPHIRHQPQRRRVLDGLVRRAVFSEPDRIVSKHEDVLHLHQRRHAQRITCVIGEHEERAGIRNDAAMQRQSVAERRHAKLAHAEINIVAASVVARDHFRAAVFGEVGPGQVGGTAGELGQHRRKRIQRDQ